MKPSNGVRHPLVRENIDNKATFSRQLMKDSSAANASSRILYYGSGGSIPFRWEARPGTPKHPSATSSSSHQYLPPLTPPPSYQAKLSHSTPGSGQKTMPKVVRAILSKLTLAPASPRRLLHMSPSSSVSSSSSSSSTWSLSSPSSLRRRNNNLSRSRFPLKIGIEDDEMMDVTNDGSHEDEDREEEDELEEYLRRPSPTSTLSFCIKKHNATGTGSRFRGCYPLFSITTRHQSNV